MQPPAKPHALIKALRARGLTPLQHRMALILLAVNGPANAWTFVEHVQAPPEEEPMKTSLIMKKLVTQLCAQHGVDLAAPAAYLKLKLPGDAIMPLIIERLGRHRLCIAHYYVCDEYSGELAADPDVEILVTPQGDWVPIAVQMPAPFGYRCYAELDSDDQRIARWTYAGAHQGQGDLACFVNQWAKNLEAQGFLTRATVVAARPEPKLDQVVPAPPKLDQVVPAPPTLDQVVSAPSTLDQVVPAPALVVPAPVLVQPRQLSLWPAVQP